MQIIFRLLFLIVFFLFFIATGFANNLDKKLARYIQEGSVLVADDQTVLYSYHADQLFIPASILKLATALAALHYLGKDYHYKTEFFLNDQNDLTIRGSGDPQLISEEFATIAKSLSLHQNFPNNLRNLYLDVSLFAPNILIPGVENSLNPYDALNGPLVANFNTIYVKIDSAGKIHSAEPQTPLIPLARQLAKELPPGKHRINISRQGQHILPYTGGLLQAFLRQEGIEVSGKIQAQSVFHGDQLVYTHQNSRLLTQTIESMMLYSNNFIANQLFLTVGMEVFGTPAKLEKGRKAVQRFLEKDLKMAPDQFHLVEGSGISRKNRFTAQGIMKLLKAFLPYKSLLAKHKGVRLKTGTLRGVYTMAGYLPDNQRNRYFVIMLNQKRNYRDKILSLLLKKAF